MATLRIANVDPVSAGSVDTRRGSAESTDGVATDRVTHDTTADSDSAVDREKSARQGVIHQDTIIHGTITHGTITQILGRIHRGDDEALAQAVTAVYQDLQGIASRRLAGERRTPTFDTESLIHEVYLRLAGQDRTQWQNRQHFFAIATRIMRRILVDRARSRGFAKRGGGQAKITTLEDKDLPDGRRELEVVTLDDALTDLARHDDRLAQIVELRFFGGLNNPEIAAIQGVTSMTIIRRWRLARAWLHRYLAQVPAVEAP